VLDSSLSPAPRQRGRCQNRHAPPHWQRWSFQLLTGCCVITRDNTEPGGKYTTAQNAAANPTAPAQKKLKVSFGHTLFFVSTQSVPTKKTDV
jgi:hypothetical protein